MQASKADLEVLCLKCEVFKGIVEPNEFLWQPWGHILVEKTMGSDDVVGIRFMTVQGEKSDNFECILGLTNTTGRPELAFLSKVRGAYKSAADPSGEALRSQSDTSKKLNTMLQQSLKVKAEFAAKVVIPKH